MRRKRLGRETDRLRRERLVCVCERERERRERGEKEELRGERD